MNCREHTVRLPPIDPTVQTDPAGEGAATSVAADRELTRLREDLQNRWIGDAWHFGLLRRSEQDSDNVGGN